MIIVVFINKKTIMLCPPKAAQFGRCASLPEGGPALQSSRSFFGLYLRSALQSTTTFFWPLSHLLHPLAALKALLFCSLECQATDVT